MVEIFKNRELSVIVFHDGEIQIDVSVSPVSYTHLDVYKRQAVY